MTPVTACERINQERQKIELKLNIMKTLGKLKINSEKIINDKELQNLKGGDGPCCVCLNGFDDVMCYMAAYDDASCIAYCGELHWEGSWGNWTYC